MKTDKIIDILKYHYGNRLSHNETAKEIDSLYPTLNRDKVLKTISKFSFKPVLKDDPSHEYIHESQYTKLIDALCSLSLPTLSEEEIGPFAQWREANRWFTFEDGKWKYTFEQGTCISDESYEKNYTKTTSELIQMYRKELTKPKEE